MPHASDFRLYHGNDLDVLAGVVASELARHDAALDPLTPDTILIPQPSMRRWLQNTLARTHGVAANLRFLTPGEFVREALAANLGDDDAAVADAAQLRWRLWDRLGDASLRRAPALAPLRALLDDAQPERAAWNLAGEVALAFEKYQAWRRDWLLDWDRGAQPGDWQAELWRHAARGGGRHRGIRLRDYLSRFGEGGEAIPAGLPRRLFAFCCQNVSPDVLRMIASQARAGTLHFFFVSPVERWWGDLQTARERLREAPDDCFAPDEENPLLRANGAAGRDFVRLLFSYEVAHPSWEQAIYVPPDPGLRDGLLHHMQRDLLARRAPAATVPERPQDASLQFHRCHTRLREVQVLHDRLRALLDDDASLHPRDIAVLTPDIDRYAPDIHAVFGTLQGDRRYIPYTIADGSALAAHPLIDTFLRFLALPDSRFTTSEVLELLAQPAVAQRFGLDAGDLDALRTWLHDAGARWALDARHRAAHEAPRESAYTWAWALDRILLGHAGGDDTMVGGIAPWPELEGSAIATLDAALQALRTFARLQREFGRAMPPAHWQERIAQALEDLVPTHPADADTRRALEVLRHTLNRFGDETRLAGIERDVPPDVVRAWFDAALGEDQTRQPFLGGGVNFARMVPMRLIPFRVICLIGMDDDAFPRRDPAGGINRIAQALRSPTRRLGDRSIRDDDRLLFLQLFAAATDVFYLSWIGADARSGESRPPSVVVAELAEVAAATVAGGDSTALVVAHPLQPFSPEAFGAGDPRRRSYQREWRAAADHASADHALPPFGVTLAPLADDDNRLDHATLLRDLLNPSRAWLERRLGLRLSTRGDDASDEEPFDRGDGLHRYGVREAMFEELLRDAGDFDVESLRQRLLQQARIAPGAAGRRDVAAAHAELVPLVQRWRAPQRGVARTLPFELEFRDVRVHGNLANVFDSGLHQWSLSKGHGRTHLRLGLDALIWSALGRREPVHRLIFGDNPCELAAFDAADAHDVIAGLLRVRADALSEALPWGPFAGFEYVARLAAGKTEEDAFERARAIWNQRESRDPWVALALRGRDPFTPGNAGDAERFRAISLAVFASLLQSGASA